MTTEDWTSTAIGIEDSYVLFCTAIMLCNAGANSQEVSNLLIHATTHHILIRALTKAVITVLNVMARQRGTATTIMMLVTNTVQLLLGQTTMENRMARRNAARTLGPAANNWRFSST